MLAHSFDRFYVVTKYIFHMVNDLNFLPIDFNDKCDYLSEDLSNHHNWEEYNNNFKIFCEKIIPFIDFYKKQISSSNHMSHKILNKLSLILPNYPKDRTEKRGIITSLVTGFVGLAYVTH